MFADHNKASVSPPVETELQVVAFQAHYLADRVSGIIFFQQQAELLLS